MTDPITDPKPAAPVAPVMDMTNPDFAKAVNSAVASQTEGLKLNSDKILAEKKELATKAKAFETQVNELGGIENISNIMKAAGDADDILAFKEGRFNEVLDKRTNAQAAQFEQRENKWGEERTGFETQLAQSNTRIRELTIGQSLSDEAAQAGISPAAISDVKSRGMHLFTLDEAGGITSKDPITGLDRVLNDGKTKMTTKTFVESLKESAPHLFLSSSGAGVTGSGPNKTADGIPIIKMSSLAGDQKAINDAIDKEEKGELVIDPNN